MKLFLCLLILTISQLCCAQRTDTLFVRQGGVGWHIRYRTPARQSLFAVAKEFGVPPARLADDNGFSYADVLAAGTLVKVPLTMANWYNYTPPSGAVTRPLYLRLESEDEWKALADKVGVSRRQLQEWNGNLHEPLRTGDLIAVGWVTSAGNAGRSVPDTIVVALPSADTLRVDTLAALPPILTPMEQLFLDQTANGAVFTERGTAAFFPASGGSSGGVHYAFHSRATRGSVIRVHNPGTGRTVYVKVLGPLPQTKQYAGAVIGISAAAKAALGVRDVRAWCELSYAGY